MAASKEMIGNDLKQLQFLKQTLKNLISRDVAIINGKGNQYGTKSRTKMFVQIPADEVWDAATTMLQRIETLLAMAQTTF